MNDMIPPRPKIGIALGSGVARGWAHIGVLRVLGNAGIVPDIVSGTSIGAVVGGCHVANQLEPLEEFARSLTRRRLISVIDFRFRSSGLIGDSKLEAILYKYLGGQQLENMERTFIAVATELSTGHEVWMHEGSLVQAIRASYALPGVLAPVPIDNRWLIDGALVNPVPVSVVRALGARVVIAVNLNTDPFDPVARRQARAHHPSLYMPTPPANRVGPDIEKEIAALIEEGTIGAPPRKRMPKRTPLRMNPLPLWRASRAPSTRCAVRKRHPNARSSTAHWAARNAVQALPACFSPPSISFRTVLPARALPVTRPTSSSHQRSATSH